MRTGGGRGSRVFKMQKRQMSKVIFFFLFPPNFGSVAVEAVSPSAAFSATGWTNRAATPSAVASGAGIDPFGEAGAAPKRADVPERNYFVFAQVSLKKYISSCAMI